MNKPSPKLSQLVRLFIVESRFHRLACLPRALRATLEEIAIVINIAMLPYNMPHAEILHQKLEQICFGRILSDMVSVDNMPNFKTRCTLVLMDDADDFKMLLCELVNPIQEELDYIVTANLLWRGGVRK